MTVLHIKNDEVVKRFFERRGIKLRPDPQIPAKFTGEMFLGSYWLAHFLLILEDSETDLHGVEESFSLFFVSVIIVPARPTMSTLEARICLSKGISCNP